ncbi:hypothetical protein AMTRI_Chr13g119170 [Amborella trichopoda]
MLGKNPFLFLMFPLFCILPCAPHARLVLGASDVLWLSFVHGLAANMCFTPFPCILMRSCIMHFTHICCVLVMTSLASARPSHICCVLVMTSLHIVLVWEHCLAFRCSSPPFFFCFRHCPVFCCLRIYLVVCCLCSVCLAHCLAFCCVRSVS